jgi:uncharacterized protein (TIGR03118 family)
MDSSSFLRKKRAGPDRRCWYRPVLECLEDRCLLAAGFTQVNLASDVPGLAPVTDPNLVNPWGIAFSPTGPFWLAGNGSGVSDLLDGRGQPVPLLGTGPSAAFLDGTPTGVVFNGGTGFAISENGVSAASRFLFVTENGTIAGWTDVVDPTRGLLAVDNSSVGAVYKGLALAVDPAGQSFLYAADFGRGTIDVFDQGFRPVVRSGAFQDPNLPAGFAPFNIQNIDNLLFVAYAQQDAAGRDDVAGAGHGFIDVYDTAGNLVRRFASQGALNSPWGLALAPADFGTFGGALLVGNNGDGLINAYDPRSGAFLGQLADDIGNPLTIPNLWALTFGNGHEGGDSDTLFFAAGVPEETHGLFGALQAPGRQGADTAGSGIFDPNAPGEPGDYPLPPGGGPAFRAGGADQPRAVADLLPLRESSLVLVPTLSAVSQPGTGSQAPATAVLASEATVSTPAEGDARTARGAPEDAVALSTFLDLNPSPSPNAPQKPGVQQPGASPDAVEASRSPAADPDAVAEGLLSEVHVQRREAQAGEEQGPEALPPAVQAEQGRTAAPSETRAESADERAAGAERVETRDGGDWTKLIRVVSVASIPMMWACWVSHQMWSRQSTRGTCPE